MRGSCGQHRRSRPWCRACRLALRADRERLRGDEEVDVVTGSGGLDDAAAAVFGAEAPVDGQDGCCGGDGCAVTADGASDGTPQTTSSGVAGWCVPVPGGTEGVPAVDTSFPQPVGTGQAQHVDTGPVQPVDTGAPAAAPVDMGGSGPADGGGF